MIDKTDSGGRVPDADVLRSLPDEKIEEIASCAKGTVQRCPQCGELTAFPGAQTFNCESECHNCEYRTGV